MGKINSFQALLSIKSKMAARVVGFHMKLSHFIHFSGLWNAKSIQESFPEALQAEISPTNMENYELWL